jgi:hypothetical protein
MLNRQQPESGSRRQRFFLAACCLVWLLCANTSLPSGGAPVYRRGSADQTGVTDAILTNPVTAGLNDGAGVRIDGAILNLEGTPGLVYVHHMVVSSGQQAADMNIEIGLFGMGQGPDGDFQPMPVNEDTGPYSARSFITAISKSAFRLARGTSQPVDVTISLPGSLDGNTHYAVLQIRCSPIDPNGGSTSSAGILTNYLVPVVITPASAVFKRTAEIAEALIDEPEMGEALDMRIKVKNTGNRHFRVKGHISLSGSSGTSIGEVDLPLTFNSIIPGQAQTYRQKFTPAASLPNGKYAAHIVVRLDDGTFLAERFAVFWIGPEPEPTSGSIRRHPKPKPTESDFGASQIAYGVVFRTATPVPTATPVLLTAPTGTGAAVIISTATAPAATPDSSKTGEPSPLTTQAAPDSFNWAAVYWLAAAGVAAIAVLLWLRWKRITAGKA